MPAEADAGDHVYENLVFSPLPPASDSCSPASEQAEAIEPVAPLTAPDVAAHSLSPVHAPAAAAVGADCAEDAAARHMPPAAGQRPVPAKRTRPPPPPVAQKPLQRQLSQQQQLQSPPPSSAASSPPAGWPPSESEAGSSRPIILPPPGGVIATARTVAHAGCAQPTATASSADCRGSEISSGSSDCAAPLPEPFAAHAAALPARLGHGDAAAAVTFAQPEPYLYAAVNKRPAALPVGVPAAAALLAAVINAPRGGATTAAHGSPSAGAAAVVAGSPVSPSSSTALSPSCAVEQPASHQGDSPQKLLESVLDDADVMDEPKETAAGGCALPTVVVEAATTLTASKFDDEVVYDLLDDSGDSSEGEQPRRISEEPRSAGFASPADEDYGYVSVRLDPGDYVALATDSQCTSAASLACNMPATAAAATAGSAKQLVRSGFLFKQGGQQSNKGWRKRYVTFDGKTLRYYENDKTRISKKIIAVSAMKNVEISIKDGDTDWFRFLLHCVDRTYMFASEQRDDCLIWTSVLMKAIIQSSRGEAAPISGGPEMCQPDMCGCFRIDGKAKQYVAIKKGKLCYYDSYEDFVIACPIHQIDMEIASVKEESKLKLQLSTPYHQYIFAFDTDEEVQPWKTAIEESIACALSDDTVLEQVYKNESNRHCADCDAENPDWAVLHLIITVCRNCAGVHRQFWAFKVKSLRMDQKIWTSNLVQLFVSYGNANAIRLWEQRLPSSDRKPGGSSDTHARESYISNKYKRKAYFDFHASAGDQAALDAALCNSLQKEGGLAESVQLAHSGANIKKTVACDSAMRTVLEVAVNCGQIVQAEMLRQMGSDGDQVPDMNPPRDIASTRESSVVVKAGFLDEIVKKDSLRRWAVLDTDKLSLYADEHSAIAKTAVSLAEVQHIAVQPASDSNGRSSSVLCLRAEADDGGKQVVLSASTCEEVTAWALALYKAMSAGFDKDIPEEFDMAGYVFTKEVGSMVWQNSWACLSGKLLFFCNISMTGSQADVDIRKVIKVNFAMQDSTDCPAFESSPPLMISIPNRVIYLQSNFRQDTRAWAAAIEKNHKNLSWSLEDQLRTKDNVPVIVDKCVAFVSLHGMETEGVYRLSATNSVVSRLLELLVNDVWSVDLVPESNTVHEVANACKRYLRNLSDPVMTSDLRSKWLQARAVKESAERIQAYKALLTALPSVNRSTLKYVLNHLRRVSNCSVENKMNITNLATVFGPVLMTSSNNDFSQTNVEIDTVADLISHYSLIFDVGQAEINREEELWRQMKLLLAMREGSTVQQQSAANTVLSELLLSIYIGDKFGPCVNVNVAADMSASQLVERVYNVRPQPFAGSAQSGAVKVADCSVYEVICGRDLERPLGDDELVLDAVRHWEAWPEEERRDNYLCVKKNLVNVRLSSMIGLDMARVCELNCCLSTGWKKLYCEFVHATLTCFKDSMLKVQAGSFGAKDMIVYLGVEKRRKPPTKIGFTFFMRSDFGCLAGQQPQQRPAIVGRSICYDSESNMDTWLAAILWAQRFPTHRGTSNGPAPRGSSRNESSEGHAHVPTADDKKPAARMQAIKQSFKDIMQRK